MRFGVRDRLVALPRSAPRAHGNEVTYARGPLVEWYRNGPLGLEQGFDVRRAPGAAARPSLTLALRLTGNMRAASNGRGGLLLTGPADRQLSYGGLNARDARGTVLPAQLSLSGRVVRITVRTRGAAFPVTIDPFIQLAKVGDPTGELLGDTALAVAGTTAAASDRIVVGGLPVDTVDIFTANPGGWTAGATLQARLQDGSGGADDEFGTSLALTSDGTTLFVGAPLATVVHQSTPNQNEGAVFVFNRAGSTWTSTTTPSGLISYTRTSAPPPSPSVNLGTAVAVTGTGPTQTLALGIPLDLSANGSVAILQKGNSAWGGQAVTDGALLSQTGSHNLGATLAMAGNTVVAGSPNDNNFQGTAWVFREPGGGWATTTHANATLTASDGQGDDFFGTSVAISLDDNVIVIGAVPSSGIGKAYVFTSPGGQWSGSLHENAILRASDGVANDEFGAAVAVAGNTILVTAHGATVNNHAGQGAGYVFTGRSETWTSGTQSIKFTSADGQPSDQLGQEAVLEDAGATAIMTAPAIFPSALTGAIYVFGTVPTTRVSVSPAAPDGAAGWYVHPVTVSVSAADANSSVSATRCVLDPASAPTGFGALPATCGFTGAGAGVAGNGRHVLYAGSANAQGYAEPGPLPSATFAIDTVAPIVKCAPTPTFKLRGSGGLIVATVSDATSGAAQATVTGRANVSRTGRKSIVLTGRDNAGNSASVTCRYTVAAPRLDARLSYLFNVLKRYTVFTSFAAANVPRGATVAVSCKGHGCRFKRRSVKVPTTHRVCKAHHKHCRRRRTPALNTVGLAAKLVNAHLGVGTRLTVDITQRNTIGQYWIIKIRSNKQPSVRTSCLAPGKTKPTKSCT